MDMFQPMSVASDRLMAARVSELEGECGHRAGRALAHWLLKAGETELCGDAWGMKRWIGAYENVERDGIDLDRAWIIWRLDRKWFVAEKVVDRDGSPHTLMEKREFARRKQAFAAFDDA